MQTVGKIGSYIGRSVYTVSGPFHPFGGAVDIIVVEQPDGTYKSSPWYVRFGKFQGVLKTKEKVVSISVNDVEADFHMYLNHKGEAFFLKEADLEGEEFACSTPYSSDDSLSGYDRDSTVGAMTRTDSRRARILGLVFGRKSRKGKLLVQEEEDANDFVRTASLEHAEIAADLLDLKWSTNLASSRVKKDNSSKFSALHMQTDEVTENPVDGCGCDDTGLASTEPNEKPESAVGENEVEVKFSDIDSIAEPASSVESTMVQTDISHSELLVTDKLGLVESDLRISSISAISEVSQSRLQNLESVVKLNVLSEGSGIGPEQCIEQRDGSLCCGPGEACVHTEAVENIILKSEPGRDAVNENDSLNIQECFRNGDHARFLHEETVSVTGGTVFGTSESTFTECLSQSVSVHQSNDSVTAEDSQSVATTCLPAEQQTVFSRILGSEISPEEQLMFGSLDDYSSSDGKSWKANYADQEPKDSNSSVSSTVTDGTNEGIEARCSVYSLDHSVIDDYINDANPLRRKSRSISSDISSINETGHAHSKELIRMVRSLPSMEITNDTHQLSGAQAKDGDFKSLNECREGPPKPSFGRAKSAADAFGERRRGWPFSFKRSRTAKASHMDMKGGRELREVMNPDNTNDSEVGNEGKAKAKRKVIKMLTPTSEQLASLNLKEGKNAVVFTFSTAMLGNQQVDARIFLWRWDTQIVISDVDGTITRSDLLGQVMPLVGMDWSQTGVAHLFSAIKENGYQLLFLSARSISQSFHTRQFLCNIRQDGKALPEGPVVISPDGLFPSLYREVVRRTPHEFKIGCLEDIKALFPADRNPFYAGFGNRDTDEFSYLKVGIPRGKIFTINPKGEIVVNRHVHTKSYLSIHALVHGMFPTMTSFEQEDYNSWNYWKLPPPLVDI